MQSGTVVQAVGYSRILPSGVPAPVDTRSGLHRRHTHMASAGSSASTGSVRANDRSFHPRRQSSYYHNLLTRLASIAEASQEPEIDTPRSGIVAPSVADTPRTAIVYSPAATLGSERSTAAASINIEGESLTNQQLRALSRLAAATLQKAIKLDAFLWAAGGASGLGLIAIQFVFYIVSLCLKKPLINFDVVNAETNTPLSNMITLVTTASFAIGYYRQYLLSTQQGIAPQDIDARIISSTRILPGAEPQTPTAACPEPEFNLLENLVVNQTSQAMITTIRNLPDHRVARFLKPSFLRDAIFEGLQAFYTGCTLAGVIAMMLEIEELSAAYAWLQACLNIFFGVLAIYRYGLFVQIAEIMHQLTPRDPALPQTQFPLMPQGYNKFEIALTLFLGFVQGLTLGDFLGNWLAFFIEQVFKVPLLFSTTDAVLRSVLMAASIYHFCYNNLKTTLAMQVRISTHAQCLEWFHYLALEWRSNRVSTEPSHSQFSQWHDNIRQRTEQLISEGKRPALSILRVPSKIELKFLLSFILQGTAFMMISIYIIGMSLPEFKGSPLNRNETTIVVFSSAIIALSFFIIQGLIVSARSTLNQSLENLINLFYEAFKSLAIPAAELAPFIALAETKINATNDARNRVPGVALAISPSASARLLPGASAPALA